MIKSEESLVFITLIPLTTSLTYLILRIVIHF